MKQHLKLIIGLLVALSAIGLICVVALRYMDVILNSLNAVKERLNIGKWGDDMCDCCNHDEDETEEDAEDAAF